MSGNQPCSNPSTSSSPRLSKANPKCPRVRHILTGTFNTRFLHLLSFDTLTRTLSIQHSLLAQGPHQFLVAGRTEAARGPSQWPDRVYATTWAEPPELSAWSVERDGKGVQGIKWINTVPITATTSYVHVQPPAYSSRTSPSYNLAPGPSRFLYSAGGPTGEVHSLDAQTGAIGEKVQELVFLRGGEEELKRADKTRKALRYGSHNVDIGVGGMAYVADLGRNSILVYKHDAETGLLRLISEKASPEEGDGPRHVVPSPDGRFVLSVTEHTSFVDVFELRLTELHHVQRLSILPEGRNPHDFRGDTVRFSPDGQSVLASTRGMTESTRGFVRAWSFDSSSSPPLVESPLHTFETPTSGGKANALEFAPRYEDDETLLEDGSLSSEAARAKLRRKGEEGREKDLAVLTDDEKGYVLVLEWDGEELKELARTRLQGESEDGDSKPEGASHAIWLS